MSYQPKIITPDEVRVFLNPFLSYDDIDDATILLKIEAVERYISDVWFNGDYPESARIPALLLTASKIIKEPSMSDYREVKKIGDVTFETQTRFKSGLDPYELALTWEDMALSILRSYNQANIFKIKKVNP